MEVRYPTGTVSHQFSSFSSLIRANPDASLLPPKCVATTLDSSLDIPYSCSTGTWQFRCFALVSWDESHNLVGSKIRVLESSSRLSLSSLSPLPPQTAVRDFTGASNPPSVSSAIYVRPRSSFLLSLAREASLLTFCFDSPSHIRLRPVPRHGGREEGLWIHTLVVRVHRVSYFAGLSTASPSRR